jgi:uncharacterized integral membrane protein
MRYLYLVVFVLVTAAVLLFTLQNLASVTVTFARMRVTSPVALVVIVVYVLGMLSGGALWSLVRKSYRGAFEPG